MPDSEQRFALTMREIDTDEPGLVREADGTVWLVNPDGTRTQLGTANGGSQPGALTLLGPFSIDFDTPNFVNPADNGIETLAIPAGTLVLAVVPISTEAFTGSVATDWMYVALATSPSGTGPVMGAWQLSAPDTPTVALGAGHIADASITGGSVEAMSVELQETPAFAVVDCHLIAGYFPAGAISAGSLDLYAVIATPS